MRAVGHLAAIALLVLACGSERASPGTTAASPSADAPSASASAPAPAAPSASGEPALSPVRLQLRWTLGAASAGYVAAIEQGYYESAGLDVELVEGGPDIDPEMAGSRPDGPEFTISWVPRVLVARTGGSSDLVELAQVFRRSSTLAMAFRTEEITSPSDFRGKRIGVLPGPDRLEITAAAAAAGVDAEKDATLVELGGSMRPLLTRRVDVAQATLHDTFATVLETIDRSTGRPYAVTDFDVINVEDEGTAMLQDAIFARSSWLADEANEAIAVAFLTASAQGWMYCRDHPAECVDSVVAAGAVVPSGSPAPSASASASPDAGSSEGPWAGHETWAMNEVNALVWPAPAGFGTVDPDAWAHTVDVLVAAGALPRPPGDDAYRTDLLETALAPLSDLDTTGGAFVKGTVEIVPREP